MRPAITLTTDFGTADPYVAALKGVILSINPDAVIIDVAHEIRPQNIEQGAFVLSSVLPYFPPGTIHVAVIDPGVGTDRRALALVTPSGVLVGPDNGLLSAALPDSAREDAWHGPVPMTLPQETTAYILEDPRYHRRPISATFHGRDIFAPVAAHLSLGLDPRRLGPATSRIVGLPPFRAAVHADGSLAGRVLHIDRFGNLITSVRADQLQSSRVTVDILGSRVYGLAPNYGDREGLVALIGSAGYLEIASSGGSAARELEAVPGDLMTVRPA